MVCDSRPSAVVLAFAHTPVVTLAMLLWFELTNGKYAPPMWVPLLYVLPVAGAAAVVTGILLRRRGVHAPFGYGVFLAATTMLCVAFALDTFARESGWIVWLFPVLPVPLVLALLKAGERIHRPGLRLLTLLGGMTVLLLLIDGALRYPEAQEQQHDATAGLSQYSRVAVLDAPGWRLVHAFDRAAFPELVYRDFLGRTVLLGSDPEPFPAKGDTAADGFDAEILSLENCGMQTTDLSEDSCDVRSGMLVVTMSGAPRDRELADSRDRWPFGWTEVRTVSPDGRYVRLRSDSPGVDLAELARTIEHTEPTTPEANVDGAACALRCPVWRSYRT